MVPILIYTWPIILVTSIFIIIIKIIILRSFWKNQSSKKIIISIVKTNALLALMGMPWLWLSYGLIISLPLSFILADIDFRNLRVPEVLIEPLDDLFDLVMAPGTMVYEGTSSNFLCMGIFVTFVCYFYLSYKFELFYYRSSYKELSTVSFRQGIKVANIISYLFVEICVLILWYCDLF